MAVQFDQLLVARRTSGALGEVELDLGSYDTTQEPAVIPAESAADLATDAFTVSGRQLHARADERMSRPSWILGDGPGLVQAASSS